ncbi:hypothetical protein PQ469_05910 [Mucilaginibacter sp. KACC 22773]|uniref:hypothetical protein n=1 Tax=Mucilaginibacter sp. KACC 22773 TaxID=3025671 RepID=UPI0023666A5C|nr:hypothetical protein [Mucilaginibacter sp. KACC 22773]WDF79537.1 hypothetical protein PQ469_05910 [Mucilaginibacter sp. KACC 22773]
MRELLNSYIEKTQMLIFSDQENQNNKVFLKTLNKLAAMPRANLIEVSDQKLTDAVQLIYKNLSTNPDHVDKNEALNKLFGEMVEYVILSNEARELKLKDPSFDDSKFRLYDNIISDIPGNLNMN